MVAMGPVFGGLQYAAPKIFNKRHTLSFGKRCEFAPFRCSDKSNHEKIALVDFEQESGILIDDLGVVADGGAIGGTNLTQTRIAGFKNIRNTKASANLHQFAARDDDFFFFGCEMTQDKHQRRRAIVGYCG